MATTKAPPITVRVVYNRLPNAADALHAAVVAQVKRSTLDVEKRAKEIVPVQTGTLRRSIHSVFENDGLRGICGPSVDYAEPVEYGGRGRPPRPYMRPAARMVLPQFVEQVKRLVAELG